MDAARRLLAAGVVTRTGRTRNVRYWPVDAHHADSSAHAARTVLPLSDARATRSVAAGLLRKAHSPCGLGDTRLPRPQLDP
jgi:hypothetical protein